MWQKIGGFTAVLLTAGCVTLDHPSQPTQSTYSEIELSGLHDLAPYPNDDDVCVSLKPTKPLEPYQQEGRILIACPKHEKGALQDRRSEGGRIVGHAKHWSVLSIKQ